MEKNKGITLIILVITIVVMLILASITLNIVIDGGLFEHAGRAKFITEVSGIDKDIKEKLISSNNEIKNGEIDDILGTKTGYNDILSIQKGELVYDEDKTQEKYKEWLKEIGIKERKTTIEELIQEEGLKVGDYVNYTPDVGIYKVVDGEYGSGYTTEEGYQSFTTETGTNSLKWRILSIDKEKEEIQLVSTKVAQNPTASRLWLQGADGYNHAVDILNDLCKTLYSKTINGKKVATGRSINVEDINAKTTYDYTTFRHNNTGFQYGYLRPLSNFGVDNRKYPNLYEKEIGGASAEVSTIGLNGSQGLKDGVVNEDEVTEYKKVTGYTDNYDSSTNTSKKDVNIINTYYTYTIEDYLDTSLGINTAPTGLINNLTYSFWVASRCILVRSSDYHFYIHCMDNGNSLSTRYMFTSKNSLGSFSSGVLPVVTLHSNSSLIKDTTKSTDDLNYWNIEF